MGLKLDSSVSAERQPQPDKRGAYHSFSCPVFWTEGKILHRRVCVCLIFLPKAV